MGFVGDNVTMPSVILAEGESAIFISEKFLDLLNIHIKQYIS